MKKIMLVLAGIALLVALVPTTIVLAAPPNPPDYGKVDPLNISNIDEFLPQILKVIPAPWVSYTVSPEQEPYQVHIVNDPLVEVNGSGATGSVTFWCQSQVGFQYQIIASGLASNTSYNVTTSFLDFVHFEFEDPTLLGILHTDVNGNGSVRGVIPLPPSTLFPYYLIVGVDLDGTPVLGPGADPNEPFGLDGQGFIVY